MLNAALVLRTQRRGSRQASCYCSPFMRTRIEPCALAAFTTPPFQVCSQHFVAKSLEKLLWSTMSSCPSSVSDNLKVRGRAGIASADILGRLALFAIESSAGFALVSWSSLTSWLVYSGSSGHAGDDSCAAVCLLRSLLRAKVSLKMSAYLRSRHV